MGDEERSGSFSDVDIWERLLQEQTTLFKTTTERNKVLEAKLEELEREVSVWKLALKASHDENEQQKKSISRLERNIGSLKDDNPLILCLIDGDGNIFAPELIAGGRAGGRHAAMLLTKGITDHMTANDNDGSSSRGQIWLTIYCNKKGLAETLTNTNMCTAEQFEEFFMGFNQANPLFSFIDVGVGKEAADSKIKECLRVFSRFPQTSRVYFGGGHDNGYTSTLNQLQTEGLHSKVTILRGYKDIAYELRSLNLPFLEIEGVFITKKLQNTYKKSAPATAQSIDNVMKKVSDTIEGDNNNGRPRQQSVSTTSMSGNWQQLLAPQPASPQPIPQQVFLPRPAPPQVALPRSAPPQPAPSQPLGLKLPTPNLPMHKQKPPACNFHYLNWCMHGTNCRYSHNYLLSVERRDEMSKNAKKWPCPYINTERNCPYGDNCCMAHRCPYGIKCKWVQQGKCKFTGKGMHDNNALPIIESSEGNLTPPTAASPSASSYMQQLYPPSPSTSSFEQNWSSLL